MQDIDRYGRTAGPARESFTAAMNPSSPGIGLPEPADCAHVRRMFVVDEPTAAAIRQAFIEGGQLSAAVELRRHFPLLTDSAAGRCARAIAGWHPVAPTLPDDALP